MAQAEAPAPRLLPNLAELYRDKVASLQALLREPGSEGAQEAIRVLIDEIRLAPDRDDSAAPLTMEVRGSLRRS